MPYSFLIVLLFSN